MLYKHISARPVEQLDAVLKRGIYETFGADERDVCRPRTASKHLSSVATESLANECNRDLSTVDHSDGGNITGCLGVDTLNHSA